MFWVAGAAQAASMTEAERQTTARSFMDDTAGAGDVVGGLISGVVSVVIISDVIGNGTLTENLGAIPTLVLSFVPVGISVTLLTKAFKNRK